MNLEYCARTRARVLIKSIKRVNLCKYTVRKLLNYLLMKKSLALPAAISFFFFIICSNKIDAQVTTATLGGIVKDSKGAPLNGATVTVEYPDAGIKQVVTTKEDGRFTVPNLRVGGPYKVTVNHDEEIAKPGYYSVRLKRYNIKAELTATERVGFHRYTFPGTGDHKIIVDLESGIGWDRCEKALITKMNDSTLTGYRFSKGWAKEQWIYFAAIFSRPVKQFSFYDSSAMNQQEILRSK